VQASFISSGDCSDTLVSGNNDPVLPCIHLQLLLRLPDTSPFTASIFPATANLTH
jgi:hypothetical protein